MSEKPEPTKPNPTAPPSASQTSSLNQVIEKVQPIAEKAWVNSRPTLSAVLKATSNTLQSAADNLDQQIAADATQVAPLNIEPVKKAASKFWEKAQPIWAKLIGLIRSRLPEDISGKLGDRALSGVLAGFALILLSITTHLPSGSAAPKPAKPVAAKPAANPAPAPQAATRNETIAKQYPVDAASKPQQAFPDSLSAPGTEAKPAPQPIKAAPSATAKPVTPAAPTTAAPATVPATPSPIASKPAATPAAANKAPTPPPQLAPVKLTPEQKLLVKLQEVVGDQSDVLTSVVPNKVSGTLKVKLNQDWYQLPLAQQDNFAQSLLDKAQNLRFTSLELLDPQGQVVARSPVVGNEMVVLLRQVN